MEIKFYSLYIFILLALISISFCEEEKACDENDEYKVIYDNLFLEDEKDIKFDFQLNEKIIDYIKSNKMITYPRNLFRGSFQGNFLHFIHLVYKKKLPLYFTYDQILYPYIEITNDITQKIMEKGIHNIFYNFLKKIIDYINDKQNYDEDLLIYFSIGLKLLEPNYKSKYDVKINNIIDNILKVNNEANITNNNIYYNFRLFGYDREINKMNFVKVNPLFGASMQSKRLFYCITFFQNFIFNIRNELFIIYQIGELITQTNQKQLFKQIKLYFKYIFNEEENLMNPLEIYNYINVNYKHKNKTKDEINFNLYYKMKDNIIKNRTFNFMSQFVFNNENEEIEFNNQIKSKISLFSYSYNIKDWINYKLLDINKQRIFPSFYEYITLVHHGNKMKKLIMNRYNYGKNKTTKTGHKMLKFRDGINMEKEFNEAYNEINKSLNIEKDNWENSYENSFNYLLNIIGHSNDNLDEKNNSWIESKIFNTLIGSYIHFKKDIFLFKQTTIIEGGENGTLIDVYFEDNIEFYQELNKITLIFKKYSLDIINQIKSPDIREELEKFIEIKLNRLFIAYKNIIKSIQMQNDDTDYMKNNERNKIIENLFYYNKEKNIYEGWYVDLYKINNDSDINYHLDIYAYNYYVSKPINELNFTGAIIFGAMNFPEFGVIGIRNKLNKTMKLFIQSFYSGNEYPHSFTDKIDFKSLKRLIIRR